MTQVRVDLLMKYMRLYNRIVHRSRTLLAFYSVGVMLVAVLLLLFLFRLFYSVAAFSLSLCYEASRSCAHFISLDRVLFFARAVYSLSVRFIFCWSSFIFSFLFFFFCVLLYYFFFYFKSFLCYSLCFFYYFSCVFILSVHVMLFSSEYS